MKIREEGELGFLREKEEEEIVSAVFLSTIKQRFFIQLCNCTSVYFQQYGLLPIYRLSLLAP